MSFVLLKVDRRWSCRCAPTADDESVGLDISQHGEEAYVHAEGSSSMRREPDNAAVEVVRRAPAAESFPA